LATNVREIGGVVPVVLLDSVVDFNDIFKIKEEIQKFMGKLSFYVKY